MHMPSSDNNVNNTNTTNNNTCVKPHPYHKHSKSLKQTHLWPPVVPFLDLFLPPLWTAWEHTAPRSPNPTVSTVSRVQAPETMSSTREIWDSIPTEGTFSRKTLAVDSKSWNELFQSDSFGFGCWMILRYQNISACVYEICISEKWICTIWHIHMYIVISKTAPFYICEFVLTSSGGENSLGANWSGKQATTKPGGTNPKPRFNW